MRVVRVPMAELAGEMSGVGEPAGAPSWGRPRRELNARWKEALRRFRRRSQTRAKVTRRIRARTEHTAMAALPCPVRLLPDVVDAAGDAGLSVVAGGADVGFEATTAGVDFACVVVVMVRGVGLADTGDATPGCRPWVAWGTCIMVAEQTVDVPASVRQLKFGGGGPGSSME